MKFGFKRTSNSSLNEPFLRRMNPPNASPNPPNASPNASLEQLVDELQKSHDQKMKSSKEKLQVIEKLMMEMNEKLQRNSGESSSSSNSSFDESILEMKQQLRNIISKLDLLDLKEKLHMVEMTQNLDSLEVRQELIRMEIRMKLDSTLAPQPPMDPTEIRLDVPQEDTVNAGNAGGWRYWWHGFIKYIYMLITWGYWRHGFLAYIYMPIIVPVVVNFAGCVSFAAVTAYFAEKFKII